MAYNHLNPSRGYMNASDQSVPFSKPASALKPYQFFIFSVPIVLTFILIFFFYLCYLRRRRADWSSIRMRTSLRNINDMISRSYEIGLKKEVRKMLPIIVYKDNGSFSVSDTQCSVCLGEYKAEDRLQEIPSCGHIFHMDCIDHWLSTHTTCPLCRLPVLFPPTTTTTQTNIQDALGNEASLPQRYQTYGETEAV